MGSGQSSRRPWDHLLDSSDREVIRRAGYGAERGLGSGPALLLIDFQQGYLGAQSPILDQLDAHPLGAGQSAWDALQRALPVLLEARTSGVPVLITRIAHPAEAADRHFLAAKRGHPRSLVDGSPATMLAAELQAREDEIVTKSGPSAFFDTGLAGRLQQREVDSVLIGGLSTSGCIRATAVDAATHGFRVAIMEDAVADRLDISHRVALLDMWMKYADIWSTQKAIGYLRGLVIDRPP